MLAQNQISRPLTFACPNVATKSALTMAAAACAENAGLMKPVRLTASANARQALAAWGPAARRITFAAPTTHAACQIAVKHSAAWTVAVLASAAPMDAAPVVGPATSPVSAMPEHAYPGAATGIATTAKLVKHALATVVVAAA
jgi:hypothetical protein